MLSDSIFEVREALMRAYRHYCMDSDTFVGVYDEEMKSRVRQLVTDMTRILLTPGMDIPPVAEAPLIEDWDPTVWQDLYPQPET